MNGGLIARPIQLAELQLCASLGQAVCRRLDVGETSLPVSEKRTEQWFEPFPAEASRSLPALWRLALLEPAPATLYLEHLLLLRVVAWKIISRSPLCILANLSPVPHTCCG